MTGRLLIEDRGCDARVAFLQGVQGTRNGVDALGEAVVEVQIERADAPSLVGSIRRGRVRRVVPGLKAAFVELGLERPGMLPARETPMPGRAIADVLHVGEHVLVQVVRDPVQEKGARLSMRPTLPGRYLALLPGQDRLAVSQRIRNADEQGRLRALTQRARESLGTSHGCIVRSAAESAGGEAIEAELRHLLSLWAGVEEARRRARVGEVLHQDVPLPLRAVRDLAPNEGAVTVNERSTFVQIQGYMRKHAPELASRLVLHEGATTLFESTGVERAIDAALEPRVALPCGGHLVIETTEAMTTVDVNSGAFAVAGDDDVARVNREAAEALSRELRRRNVGGIVVIDFVEMPSRKHRREVLDALRAGLADDPAATRVSGMSPLGLVELSRRRRGPSLSEQLERRCPVCHGKGRRRSDAAAGAAP
ncbi:MAG: Rne/Rng family ribonuclease [Gammaproteobacteria bacterium]|nr:Rne/Rng family ribonuclease [Gammaproteobacteria bacterium]